MSSFFSSFSPSISSPLSSGRFKNTDRGKAQSCKDGTGRDMTFLEMVKNSPYVYVKEVNMEYEIYIDRSRYHWFLCVRGRMEGSDFPYLTLEASTSDFKTLTHEMYVIQDAGELSYCDAMKISLTKILSVGDRIIGEMGTYSLLSSNCQHFCNNVLKHFGFTTYPPTIGREVTAVIRREETVENAALIREITKKLNKSGSLDNELEQILRSHFAIALNSMVGVGHK